MKRFFKWIAYKMPSLKLRLKQGGLKSDPESFVKKTFLSAVYLTIGLLVISAGFLAKTAFFLPAIAILLPVLFSGMFFYFLMLPDVKSRRIRAEINSEIVDAGRFLIVELESGVSLYDGLRGVANNFNSIGKYFRQMVVSIDNGTSVEDAISTVLEYTPSSEFRRLLLQVVNSLETGSDVARGLRGVVEQISQEHLIEVRRYGRKLNPLSMFYMIIAIIVPSLGVAMLVVFSSLLSLQVDFAVLMAIAFFLVIMQFLFLAVVRNSRPAINM